MTESANSTMPVPGEIRLDRDALVRRTLEEMAGETRRGTRSAIDDLPQGVLLSVGLMKLQGVKHNEIHAELVRELGLESDDEDAPNYHALNRWLDRFWFKFALIRAAERSRLASSIELAKATGDLREGTILANQMMVQRILDMMAESQDFRDLNNGQWGNLISALSVATKAGLDDRKLDKALELADARIANLTTRTQELQDKIDRQRSAIESAKAQMEAKAQASADGKTIDLQSVAAMLDQIMREAA